MLYPVSPKKAETAVKLLPYGFSWCFFFFFFPVRPESSWNDSGSTRTYTRNFHPMIMLPSKQFTSTSQLLLAEEAP